MAQVTMDSKEYLELIAAQRELEQLKKDMLAGFSFSYDENSYNKYRSRFNLVIPKDVQEQITEVVVKKCVESPELMKECWQDNLTVFDMDNMTLTRHWTTLEKNSVDLMEYPDFQTAYNLCGEEETAEDKEEE